MRFEILRFSTFAIIFYLLNAAQVISDQQKLPYVHYKDGILIKVENSNDIYLVYNKHRYHIPNPVTFEALGFSWDNVTAIKNEELSYYQRGWPLPHTPTGSLMKERDKLTVYILWEGKRIGISDPQTARDLRGDRWNRSIIEWPIGVLDLIPYERDFPKSSTWGKHHFPGGFCTWYVSLKRKVPWSGHAKDWLSNARSSGFLTGDSPVPGFIMVTDVGDYGHVAFVEYVTWDRDGKWKSFQVSEMNWGSLREPKEYGETVNFNKVTKRFFTKDKPPNPKNLLGFIY